MPLGHGCTTTFIAGLRLAGMVAPAIYEGAINTNMFLAYVEQVLVATLVPSAFAPPGRSALAADALRGGLRRLQNADHRCGGAEGVEAAAVGRDRLVME